MAELVPDSEEIYVARHVGDVSLKSRGLDLGRPRLHDDGTSDSMYDIEFPDARPPVALEVTSLTDSQLFKTTGTAVKLADEATAVASRFNTGNWLFEIGKDSRLGGAAERWILDVVEGKVSDFNSDVPVGIVGIHRSSGPPNEVRLMTWSSTSATALVAIHPGELEERIEKKRVVLALASHHERHLAICLRTLRSRDLPPPPDLPDDIDLLWLLWWESDLTFWYERGSEAWQSNRHPWS